jgi:hypothetical protein
VSSEPLCVRPPFPQPSSAAASSAAASSASTVLVSCLLFSWFQQNTLFKVTCYLLCVDFTNYIGLVGHAVLTNGLSGTVVIVLDRRQVIGKLMMGT